MIPDTTSPAASTIIPDGESLTADSLLDIARDPTIQVELTPEIRKRVIASRKLLDEFVDAGRVIYGATMIRGLTISICFIRKGSQDSTSSDSGLRLPGGRHLITLAM